MTMSDPHLQGLDRVREVFTRVRNGDRSVADLYAPDAVVEFGDGNRVEGREAIRGFYGAAIDKVAPKPEVEVVVEVPGYQLAIVNVPTAAGRQRAVDLFQLGDEGIVKLEMFTRNMGFD